MSERPDFIVQGDTPRLFPVLADSSREGRTLSIFLACMLNVPCLQRSLLAETGLKVGARTKVQAFTEVVMKKAGTKNLRPDAVLIVTSPNQTWKALIEAKVGSNELNQQQVEDYLELAKLNGIDALITVSNQFAPHPAHHPMSVNQNLTKKVLLYHWSWNYLLTEAAVQVESEELSDKEQVYLVRELVRYLSHNGSGLQNFEQMPPAWSDLVAKVQSGTPITAQSNELHGSLSAWYQELQDVCSMLTRQRKSVVSIKLSKNKPITL